MLLLSQFKDKIALSQVQSWAQKHRMEEVMQAD